VERGDTEQLVVAMSVRGSLPEREVLALAVSDVLLRVHEAHGVSVSEFLLVRPRAIGGTTSGKIQRTACRDQFIAGTLDPLFTWRQGDGSAAASMAVPEPVGDIAPTPTAAWMLATCRALMRNDHLTSTSSLVECGASSIELGQLMAAIEERFRVQPSFERVFALPTPRTIAAAVDDALEAWIASMSEEQLQALLAPTAEPA
jgi:acyl carrier protein